MDQNHHANQHPTLWVSLIFFLRISRQVEHREEEWHGSTVWFRSLTWSTSNPRSDPEAFLRICTVPVFFCSVSVPSFKLELRPSLSGFPNDLMLRCTSMGNCTVNSTRTGCTVEKNPEPCTGFVPPSGKKYDGVTVVSGLECLAERGTASQATLGYQ